MNKKSKFYLKIFKFKGIGHNLKSFLYTALIGFFFVVFFSATPKLIVLKNNLFIKSIEVKNESKNNLEKVLKIKKNSEDEEQEDEFDNLQVFEDIFRYEEIPTSTVRLSASTIKELFKETNYNLKNVRKEKIVKPVNLELLPNEMKMIENTKKRKEFFLLVKRKGTLNKRLVGRS